ncbi:MAG: DinB family protein [Armatimonadetes bacterium]|nr:DinB family protein [Armatimonadota bacterium]
MESQADFLKRLQQVLNTLAVKTQVLDELTPAQWAWSPNKNTWSLATTLDHLNISNGAILPLYENSTRNLIKSDKTGTPPLQYNRFERVFLRLVSPNPPFKVPVPPMYKPSLKDVNGANALSIFRAQHEAIANYLASCEGYDLMTEIITSPASRLVKLRLGAQFDALLSHDQYHWGQIEEKLKHPNFPQ